jgi:hypothetical protein
MLDTSVSRLRLTDTKFFFPFLAILSWCFLSFTSDENSWTQQRQGRQQQAGRSPATEGMIATARMLATEGRQQQQGPATAWTLQKQGRKEQKGRRLATPWMTETTETPAKAWMPATAMTSVTAGTQGAPAEC